MANLSSLSFIPTVWSAVLLDNLYTNVVYAGPGVVNRDYEGDADFGNTVKITSVTDVAISDYALGGSLTYTEVATTDQSLLIDQAKDFTKKLDDINKKQARDSEAMINKVLLSASTSLGLAADTYVASLFTGADSGNKITANGYAADGSDVYNALLDMGVLLDENDVPEDGGRYAVMSPAVYARLLVNPNFINADKAADNGMALRKGFVGQAAGFNIFKSNNAPSAGAGHSSVTAGHTMAITFAEQISEMETLRLESTFADALRGLHVYGAKLTRPKAVAVADVTLTAPDEG